MANINGYICQKLKNVNLYNVDKAKVESLEIILTDFYNLHQRFKYQLIGEISEAGKH